MKIYSNKPSVGMLMFDKVYALEHYFVDKPENYRIVIYHFEEKDVEELNKMLEKIPENKYLYIRESFKQMYKYIELILPNVNFVLSKYAFKEDKWHWTPEPNYLFFNNEDDGFFVNDYCEKKHFICNDPITTYWENKMIIYREFKKYLGENIHFYGSHPKLKEFGENYKGIMGFKRLSKSIYYNKKSFSKSNTMKNYKFILVTTQTNYYGYFCEKIIDSLCCMSVPVYFGSPNAKTIFPELFDNAVIDGFEFENIEKLCDFLQKMTDEEYIERVDNIKKLRRKYIDLTSFNSIHKYINDFVSGNVDKTNLIYIANENIKKFLD